MCFSGDQHPPLPPKTSEVAQHGAVELVAADGNRFAAFDAVPQTPRGASLVLLPDIRGMHPYYTDLAVACALAGLDTVALDPYARTAGLTGRGEDFGYRPHAEQLTHEQVLLDATAAAERLRGRSDNPVFTLGFCKFGAESWRLAATDLGAAGCIGFYGMPGAAADVVGEMTAPLLVLAAGADAATSPEQTEQFDRALTDQGVEHRVVTYEGAPHSFFDRGYAAWEEACSDAWEQILGFVDAHR